MTTVDQRIAYEQSLATADESSRCLLAAFQTLGVPDSLIDIGCGPGHLVALAASMGVAAAGVDIVIPEGPTSWFEPPALANADLTQPFAFPHPARLVLCWEVAEHLPSEAAEVLCATIASACEPGGVLLFSAAVPGQGGAGHLNEQPAEYWIDRLTIHGFGVDHHLTAILRGAFIAAAPTAWWYGKNVLALRKALA